MPRATMNDLYLAVARRWEDESSAIVKIYDDKVEIGKINYEVDGDVGRVIDTIIYEKKYRGRGIIAQLIEGILCDMKCKGAKKVEVSTPEKRIWSRFGFKETGPSMGQIGMERSLKDLECDCMSRVVSLIEKLGPIKEELQAGYY